MQETLSITSHSQRDMNFSAKVSKVNGFQIPVFQNQIKDKAFCILYLNLSGRLCRPSEAHIVHSGDADDVSKLHQLYNPSLQVCDTGKAGSALGMGLT